MSTVGLITYNSNLGEVWLGSWDQWVGWWAVILRGLHPEVGPNDAFMGLDCESYLSAGLSALRVFLLFRSLLGEEQ